MEVKKSTCLKDANQIGFVEIYTKSWTFYFTTWGIKRFEILKKGIVLSSHDNQKHFMWANEMKWMYRSFEQMKWNECINHLKKSVAWANTEFPK